MLGLSTQSLVSFILLTKLCCLTLIEQDLQKPKTEVFDDGLFSGGNDNLAASICAREVFLFSVVPAISPFSHIRI